MNRILEDMLRHYVNPNQLDWDLHLPMVEFAINNAYQESVKTSPFMLNYGQHPHTPASISTAPSDARRKATAMSAASKRPLANCFTDEMQKILTQARQSLLCAQQRQKAFHDRRARAKSFKVGDRVLLSTKNIRLKNPGTAKLMPKFVGPFEVLETIGYCAYKLLLPERSSVCTRSLPWPGFRQITLAFSKHAHHI